MLPTEPRTGNEIVSVPRLAKCVNVTACEAGTEASLDVTLQYCDNKPASGVHRGKNAIAGSGLEASFGARPRPRTPRFANQFDRGEAWETYPYFRFRFAGQTRGRSSTTALETPAPESQEIIDEGGW
jgi:hypothetical protein